jgi:hypothetical protein
MYSKSGAVVGAAGAAAAALPNTGIGYAAWLVLAFVLLVAGFAAIRTATIKSRHTARHVA